MLNFDYIKKEDTKEHNPNWSEISDNPYRILNHEPDIDKIHLYAKDPYETKHQFLINK